MASLFEHLAILTDPRVERTRRHDLQELVIIAICGVLSGAESWVEIEAYGKAKVAWLRTFLALPGGIPSHDTFGRVFAALDAEAVEAAFTGWVRDLVGSVQGVVAIDGKTIRGSHDRAQGKRPLHLVSAWAVANHVVLGQIATDIKSNEITAIPALLQTLALTGTTVTIDAMGCQTAIAAAIIEQQADYVLALKANQPVLHEAVSYLFDDAHATNQAQVAVDHHETLDKGHGRIERRQCWTIADPAVIAYLDPAGAWPGLRSVAMVTAERTIGPTVTRETRYYLSSLAGEAAVLARTVREHWAIENELHWVLDVAFGEDDTRVRIGHAAENLAVIRRIGLNLLKQDTTAKLGIKAKRRRCGWDDAYLLQVLSQLRCDCPGVRLRRTGLFDISMV